MMYDLLVIDDEPSILRTFTAFFSDLDMEVEKAETAASGLELLKEHSVKICVVDVNLPDMNGLSLVKKILELQPDTQIFIHTGSYTFTIPPELVELGITEERVIEKPVRSLMALYQRFQALI